MCENYRELGLFVEKLSKILRKPGKCILLQFYLMYTAINLYLQSIVAIIAYLENNKLIVTIFESKWIYLILYKILVSTT